MNLLAVLCAALSTAPAPEASPPDAGYVELGRGLAALDALDPQEAVSRLEHARALGPYPHDRHCELYQGLAIAYAYLGDAGRAVAMFDMLLALDPFRALSYTLSPRVTFLFEKSRETVAQRARPELEISWPRDLRTDQPAALTVSVVADPKGFMKRLRLYSRDDEAQGAWRIDETELAAPGDARVVVLPAFAGAAGPMVRELYAVALDEAGNEVAVWASAARPRQLSARYEPPAAWYARWYVWAIAGVAVAAAAAVTVYAVTRATPETVGGRVQVQSQ